MKRIVRAERICFKVGEKLGPAFIEQKVKFNWHMGMSWQVRQRSSLSMHGSIKESDPEAKILEISTKSFDYDLGKALSAFNLIIDGIRVENLFQSSKVFNDGGPYRDLLKVEPSTAKKDPRIQNKETRHLISFECDGKKYPIEPKSFFYDYIYISALNKNKNLLQRVSEYNTFTDIEFNQKIPYSNSKGPFNCQARSCAICVWLLENNLLDDYLKNPEEYIEKIYPRCVKQSSMLNEFGL